jgi:hypothetical protein
LVIDHTWKSWFSFPCTPYSYEKIEIARAEDHWLAPVTVNPHMLHPSMNAIGLYWRPLVDELEEKV